MGSTHKTPSATNQCKGGRSGLARDRIYSVAAATTTAIKRCLEHYTTTVRSHRRN
jgi:hypothetical protein